MVFLLRSCFWIATLRLHPANIGAHRLEKGVSGGPAQVAPLCDRKDDDYNPLCGQQPRGKTIAAALKTKHFFPDGLSELISEHDCDIATRSFMMEITDTVDEVHSTKMFTFADDNMQGKPAEVDTHWALIRDLGLRVHMDNAATMNFFTVSDQVVRVSSLNHDADPGAVSQSKAVLNGLKRGGEALNLQPAMKSMKDVLSKDEQFKQMRHVVLIMLDQEPTDINEFVDAVNELYEEYPHIHVVINLLSKGLDFKNTMASIAPIVTCEYSVIENFQQEAEDIHEFNPWIVYSPMLHFLRLRGTAYAPLAKLDVKPLSIDRAFELAAHILSDDPKQLLSQLPERQKEVYDQLVELNQKATKVWNTRKNSETAPLQMEHFAEEYLPKQGK
eukprot:TRINITY_DN66089_c0_g1_i1.p1 TRINITY_DN66089_c0_g1~~TRINITY_DN66089_c0_g1_i1.p1  ORF type:complete len:387 (+),score=44.78 TRINITY_DN66089_c0_g1_i1:63-1223(+)